MSQKKVSIFMGGTGANNATDARTLLGAVSRTGDTVTGVLNVANTLLVTGNVGIGTTSPENKLFVETSTAQDSIVLRNTSSDINANNKFGFIVKESGTDKIYLRYRRDGSGGIELYNAGNGPMVFGINNTERARITTDGYVGIGTSSANALLSFGTSIIDNKIYIFDGNADKYGFGIRSNQFLIYSGAGGNPDGGILLGKFDGTTFTENMRVRNDGIVTKSRQPCFATCGTTGNYELSGVSTVPFDATPDINNGNHYNSTTSIFTAPVAGYYFVSFSVLIFPNNIDAGEYITVWASKNDNSYGVGQGQGSIPMARHSTQENQTTMGSQGIVYLAQNDNLKIKVEASGTGLTIYLIGGHAHFAAYLLG